MTNQERAAALADIEALVLLVEADTDGPEMANHDDADSVGWDGKGQPLPMTFGHVRRARKALNALAARPAAPADLRSVVARLDWCKHPTANAWRAETLIGTYEVWTVKGVLWRLTGPQNTTGEAENADAAKAAAQADYEARIFSAIASHGYEVVQAAKPALPPIETEGAREYIPLPGGWEIQTKGTGSSYRLCDTKTGERHNILGNDLPTTQNFMTRAAKEIRAAYEGDHLDRATKEG